MVDITKFPVIVISTHRSGSTILSQYIAKKYNLHWFNEPDENATSLLNFKSYSKNEKNYVLKFHARNFSLYENLDIFENSFLISIQRKNKIEQIASEYVARVRNKYIYDTIIPDYSKSIHINAFDIIVSSEVIFKANLALKNLNIKFNARLYYENLDLHELGKNSINIVTPKPENYDYLKSRVEKYLSLQHVKEF